MGTNSVIPTKAGEKAFTPRAGMTLVIALLLSMAAIILLQQANIVHFAVPNVIIQVGSWICMIVFSIRVIENLTILVSLNDKKIRTLQEWIPVYIFHFVHFYLYLSY